MLLTQNCAWKLNVALKMQNLLHGWAEEEIFGNIWMRSDMEHN